MTQPYDDSFVHDCNSGDSTSDNEDVLKLGTYTDDNGNTVAVSNPLMQGQNNRLIGTLAGIEGEDPPKTLTSRGHDTETTRIRKKQTFIDLKTGESF